MRQACSVKYQTRIRDVATQEIVSVQPMRKNLVMDGGLDAYATINFGSLFNFACVGTGTNPVNRFSAPVTFTQVGNTITASAPFFLLSDVGYILKYGAQGSGSGGAEQYITGFTSSTVVTVSSSATVAAPTLGCLWYVTQTTLQTQVKSTSTYPVSGSGTVNTINVGTMTRAFTRVFIFSAEVGTVTYNEIGWSWNGTNLFGRDLILPAGVTLIAGQQLEVTLHVSLVVSPTDAVSVPDVSAGTWDTSGTALIEYAQGSASNGQAFSVINADGSNAAPFAGYTLEPPQGLIHLALIRAAWTQLATINTGLNPNGNAIDLFDLTRGVYTPGSFTLTNSGTIPLGNLNGQTWTGIGINNTGSWMWSLQLATPNSKDSSHTLSFSFTVSWGRILVN